MEKARAAREANAQAQTATAEPAPHPADANRPKAFFTLGEKRAKAEKSSDDAKAEKPKAEKPDPKILTLSEVESFRKELIEMLVKLWELADKGLTVTAAEALDGEEAWIWRAIDDVDTAFIAEQVLAKGRANPYIGAQVRAVVDHWNDARMTMILGPKLLESAGWYQSHGLRIAMMGLNVPPKAKRRPRGSNGHQAGQPGPTQPYYAEGASYGAQ